MLGQIIPSGTGFSDVFIDEEQMIDNLTELNKVEDEFEIEEDNIDTLLHVDEEECPKDDFSFSFE